MNSKPHARRTLLRIAMVAVVAPLGIVGCSPERVSFQASDITGAPYARDFRLRDHLGNIRTMLDFRGKVVVVFFGFTQCPDVCPTSMNTMAEVKQLLGDQGNRLQVLFITVDPERDTNAMLKEYMQNFDPSFLALRPEPGELKAVADGFKVYYAKVAGKTPTSYSMDHSAGKFIFDTEGRIRLFSKYGAEASVIAEDIGKLLSNK